MRAIKTRRQAAEAGENKYYTGSPCVNGHDSLRYTTSGICCKCNAEGVKTYNKKLRRIKGAKLSGTFFYELHPEDHAAALAYCQALDLARGKVPHTPQAQPVPASVDAIELPEFIARHRAQLIAANTPAAVAYYPEP